MRLQTLYLLIACVVMLGGCSRCEKDDPKPGLKLEISIYQMVASNFVADSLVSQYGFKTYKDTSTTFVSDASLGTFFEATDTTWELYKWHFANSSNQANRKIMGKKIQVKFSSPHLDTAYLTAYKNNGKDSTTIKKPFKVISMENIGLTGSFIGTLNYGSKVYTNVVVKVLPTQESPPYNECYSARNGYAIFGVFSPCGNLDIGLPIEMPYSLMSFELANHIVNTPGDSALATYPNCGFGGGSGSCNVGVYSRDGRPNAYGQLRSHDTLRVHIPYFRIQRNPPVNSLEFPISFRGTRI